MQAVKQGWKVTPRPSFMTDLEVNHNQQKNCLQKLLIRQIPTIWGTMGVVFKELHLDDFLRQFLTHQVQKMA